MRVQDTCDVVIVGTGAGGATAARVLAAAGLEVVMVEEGHARLERDGHRRSVHLRQDVVDEVGLHVEVLDALAGRDGPEQEKRRRNGRHRLSPEQKVREHYRGKGRGSTKRRLLMHFPAARTRVQ